MTPVSGNNNIQFNLEDNNSIELDNINEKIKEENFSSKGGTLEKLRNNTNKLLEFYPLQGSLTFETLLGGRVNAPVLVRDYETPVGVFKVTKSPEITEQVLKALAEIGEKGFKNLPNIIKNNRDEYLTTLDGETYSCIEFLKADKNSKIISFEEILKLTAEFHTAAINISVPEQLKESKLDHFLGRVSYFNDLKLKEFDPEFFNTDLWEQITSLSDYFSSEKFKDIYNALPKMLIHGDLKQDNIVFVENEPVMVDFDLVHEGPRLWELGVCVGMAFLDEYLTLTENGNLLSFLETHYGNLEEIEKENFHSILVFRKFEGLAWMLSQLKQGLTEQNSEQINYFKNWIADQVEEIKKCLEATGQLISPKTHFS